jgi:CubicO group peptidase (beta-lactamase class C family)
MPAKPRIDLRRLIRFVLLTLGVLVVWTAVVGIGLLEGWWRLPLAARGNTQAFMNALVHEVQTTRPGNVGLALIEDGSVHAEHMSSVGEPVDRDTVFQVASLSKWITA